MRLISVDGVLGQGMLAPGVGTTYAVYVLINIQIDETSAGDFVWMSYSQKVFLAIVPCAYAEWPAAVNSYAAYLHPAHVAAVAVVLRVDVVGLEILY